MSDDPPIPTRWRIAAAACTAAAFALLAWVAAQGIWRWVAPRPAAVASAPAADPAATIIASGLWSGGSEAPRAAGAPVAGDLRLLGVLAERDGNGLAVFRTREGARVVATGNDVVPGTSLVAIGPTSVRLRDATGERTLELRRDDAARPPAARGVTPARPAKAADAASSASSACSLPAGFAGAFLKVHGELLDGLIAQPDSWRAMLAGDNGSVVVREDGGFATMMGLAKGDRLIQANGVPLREPDDLTGAVLRPLVASRPVRIAGTRGGQPREIFVVNATTCP
jgi:hypothetical protein